mgnify:CR=1 FL=1
MCDFLKVFENNNEVSKLSDDERSYQFPFKLDNFQEAGCYAIENQENVLICAHTGSGKTVLALYGIGWCIKNNKKAIYTSPTKSLSNQKYFEFVNNFGDTSSVGIMTGDIKINSDAQIVVMTTEILRNLLYKDKNLDGMNTKALIDFDDVGVIIMDEVHYINDPGRGKVWEEVLLMSRKDITLIMLSATLNKPEEFSSWIGNIKEKPIHLIKTSHRVVPLKHYYFKDFHYEDEDGKKRTRFEIVEICDNNHKFSNYDVISSKFKRYEVPSILNIVINKLIENNQLPALFFKFSRKKCEQMCRYVKCNLLNYEELHQINTTFEKVMLKYKVKYEHLNQYQDILKQIQKGVAYHHSGMLPILKEIVEILFSKGLIKVLFATETFAIGVNMPTKTVIFSELQKFDNNGLRFLRSDEYNQMAGRAGRRGLDKFGTVLLIPTFDLPKENTLKSIMSGKSPELNSKFHLNYQFVLKTIINKEFDTNNYLENTFYKQDKNKIKVLDIEKKKIVEDKINKMYQTTTDMKDKFEKMDSINNKLNDTFYVVKKKERMKMMNELKELKDIKNYKLHEDVYKIYKNLKAELYDIDSTIWNIDYGMLQDMDSMKKLLLQNDYIDNDNNVNKKGIIASCIAEVNELIVSEAVYKGYFDHLEFEEIVALLACLFNEKNQGEDDKYLSSMEIPDNLKYSIDKLINISEKYTDNESDLNILIGTDMNIYLDFVEPVYIWARGGTLKEVYTKTQVYEGNFVKLILRINNLIMNMKDIFIYMEKFDLLKKIENYEEILLRDEVSVNSIYVDGL